MMKHLQIRERGLLRAAAVLLLAVASLALLARDSEAGSCDEALLRCLEDASGLIGKGNLVAGFAYAAFCLEGYAFCREFLQE
jgi:hypothetical protein